MKEYYEKIPKTKLMRRCPAICRLDGKSFHTFARNFKKPFDDVLIKTMQETAKYLCENIQGCSLAYTQSDEISLLLIDYHRFETSAWFDYEIQKMCSIAASMVTLAFNKFFAVNYDEWGNGKNSDHNSNEDIDEFVKLEKAYCKALKTGAMFDARVFNIPKEEVTNYFYWRQLDCSRNSIQMVGQANFSHKELQNKSCNDIQDMLMTQKGIEWNNFSTYKKYGSCVVKEEYWIDKNTGCRYSEEYETILNRIGGGEDGIKRSHWVVNKEIPIFKGEGRKYIECLVNVREE